MSYAQQETSRDSALPIEIIEVSMGASFFYYTSADHELIVNGRTYRPLPISHESISPSVDVAKQGLKFTFPGDVEFGEFFRVQPPSEVVRFTMYVENLLSPGDFVVGWLGRIINCEWSVNGSWLEAMVENVFSSTQRVGLRRRYSLNCPYALYDSQCRVSRDKYRETSAVLDVAGSTVIVAAAVGKKDDYYAGGFLTYSNNATGNLEKRMIRSSVGSTGRLTLASLPASLTNGSQVDIYPGCNHTIQECQTKFDNVVNCGATPYIPAKNPYGGTTIY